MNQRKNIKKQRISYEKILTTLEQHQQILKKSTQEFPSGKGHVCTSSRNIKEHDVFIAYLGHHHDGHFFIKDAISQKAALIILESLDFFINKTSTPFILVKNSRKAWSLLAALVYNNPQEQLNFIGITGTNGKTSTAWITQSLLCSCNIKTMYIGTLGVYSHKQELIESSTHTTPDPDQLFRVLSLAVQQNYHTIVMEVSSHSLTQKKLGPIKFTAAAFTNFTRDHLDYHQNMNNYWLAKFSLFQNYLKKNFKAVFHQSLRKKIEETKSTKQNCIFYEHKNIEMKTHKEENCTQADVLIKSKSKRNQTSVTISLYNKKIHGTIPYISDHNSENFCAAILLSMQLTTEVINQRHWLHLTQIPGRLEQLKIKNTEANILIDYAHTPAALEKVLVFADYYRKTGGNVYLLFGCGGNRDVGKRQLMAQIAEKKSDHTILTTDNPRHEEPTKIIEDIASGFSSLEKVTIIIDRKEAISYALNQIKQNDVLIVAGKGHEIYQEIGREKIPFHDKSIIMQHTLEQGTT